MPRTPTNFILTRDLRLTVPPAALPAGMSVARVRQPGDGGFAGLDRLYTSHGFPDGWAAGMLDGGAEAVKVLAEQGASQVPLTVAAAFITRNRFRVDEIKRTYDPGPEGVYFFGDFVMPAHRGRRLQQALVRERLALSAAAGWRWALTMTGEDNPPSLRSYEAEGFAISARMNTRLIGSWRLDRFRRTRVGLPCGSLSREGVAILPFARLRRRA